MLIAQAMGEYAGGVVIAQAVERLQILFDDVRNAEPSTWAVAALAAFAVWFVIRRRR